MASIILPSRWQSQPQYPVEIDTSNPFCRGIIGAWAGNTRYDSSGRGQFLLGHVNYKPTEKGTGYAYPSTSLTVQPAYLADSANLDLPVSHTVFTLARVESTADQVLVAKGQNGLEYASWGLGVGTLGSSISSAGKLVYRVRTLNAASAREAKTSGNVETGRVLAIAGWHDGSNVKLFVDGVESGSATGSGSAPFVGTSRLYIGGDNNAGFSGGRWFVTGAIPLVILFNRALSDGEIKALSANPWQIFRPQKRVLYFDVAAPSGTTVAPSPGTLTAAGNTPGISQPQTVAPSAGAAAFAGGIPTVVQSLGIAPSAGAAVFSGNTPSISQPITVAPTAGAASFSGNTPGVEQSLGIAPSAGAAVILGYAPGISQPITVAPTAGAYTVAGAIPEISQAASIRPEAGALVAVGYVPGITQPRTVAPSAAALTVAGAVPVVSQAAGAGLVMTPGWIIAAEARDWSVATAARNWTIAAPSRSWRIS